MIIVLVIRKRKPPLGAVTMLEDEVVARRSFWRRQRQREQEITLQEFDLAQQILYDLDKVRTKNLDSVLEDLAEKAHALDENARRETQRRTDAEQEYSTGKLNITVCMACLINPPRSSMIADMIRNNRKVFKMTGYELCNLIQCDGLADCCQITMI